MSQIKTKFELDYTGISAVYSRAKKLYLENRKILSCSRCSYHRGENYKGKRAGTPQNWKKFRKTQYKIVEVKNVQDEEQIQET